MGVPLAQLARSMGRLPAAVHKTPDSASLQADLSGLERIIGLLNVLTGRSDGSRMWLQSPNPELGGRTPASLILNGKEKAVLGPLEDALLGQPA